MEWYIPSSSRSGRWIESERIKKHKTRRTTTEDWPGGRDGRRSSSGGEPSFYWSSRRLLTGRHDNRLTQHLTSDRRDAVISIYSIITNGIDGAVMLITRLFTCDSDTPALLSYSALTSLHLMCLSSRCGWGITLMSAGDRWQSNRRRHRLYTCSINSFRHFLHRNPLQLNVLCAYGMTNVNFSVHF